MKKRNKLLRITAFIITIIAILGFSYSHYEARNIRLRQYTFSSKDIPFTFDKKKIVYISDIHCNYHFDSLDIAKLVRQVNNLQTDIILLGGDYTDIDSAYSSPFFREIAKLESTFGIYSVMGNHDHWEGVYFIEKGLIDAGIKICDNQSYWIQHEGDSIKIGGVGDLWEDTQELEKTTFDLKNEDFCILLSHNPDYIEDIDSEAIDLVLSGHTHGGQVTFFGTYAPIMPSFWRPQLKDTGQKYRYGWKEHNKIPIYISSGVGVGDFPFRFYAPPEIVEITLKKR